MFAAPVTNNSQNVLINQLLRSVSIFRWAALTWAIVGVALSRDELSHPIIAVLLLALAAAFTAAASVVSATHPSLLTDQRFLALELTIGVALLLGDGFVFESARSQSLPWAWPAAGIISMGICFGQRSGLLTAVGIGTASLFTELVVLDRSQFVAAFSKIGLWLLVGTIAGALTQRLRFAEQQISLARTREEVARELHDGVLQTLAVVQRRSDDPQLSEMARDQENSLRRYLADSRVSTLGSPIRSTSQLSSDSKVSNPEVRLEPALREVAAEAERRYDLKVQVIVSPDCPDAPLLSSSSVAALVGASREAIANASKHGRAHTVTVFAEPTELPESDEFSIFVSVKDDGVGFDTTLATEGIGLSRSIRGRLDEHGGRVGLTSKPGRGTEVQLWL